MRRLSGWLSAIAALLVMVFMTGCAKQDIAELRRNYSAELRNFVIQQGPAEATAGTEDGEEQTAAPGEEAPADGDGETEAEAPAEPVTADIVLDIAVSHEGAGRLPGVTLDVTQADAEEEVKNTWTVYVDTSTMGVEKQITHTLKGVEYEEGDGFHVGVRGNVPAEERSDYKEFQQHS